MRLVDVPRGVVVFGGRRHLIVTDARVTEFYCGKRGYPAPGARRDQPVCHECLIAAEKLGVGREM